MANTIRIVMILSSIALFLPVFSGYVLAFAMLVCQLLPFWRRYTAAQQNNSSEASQFVWLWRNPIFIMLGCFALATIAAGVRDGGESWKGVVHFLGNSTVKYCLLWVFIANFIVIAVKDFDAVGILAKSLPWVTGLHLLYCLAQRQFGIDWVHGLSGIVPDNRFAYGVYRVSGFTSHPLTIGYKLCLVMAFCGALASSPRATLTIKKSMTVSAIFAWLTVLISGSRGPLLVASLTLGWLIIPFIKTKARFLALLALVGAIAVSITFVIPGIIDRFFEIFTPTSGDTRLMDLKVYSTAFLDHPFVGLGHKDFRAAISAYYERFGGDDKIGLAHNVYLQIAAELGLVGLVGFLQWIAVWAFSSRRLRLSAERWAFLSLFWIMISSGITQNSLRDSGVIQTLTFLTIMLGAFFSLETDIRDVNDSERTKYKDIQSREDS